MGSRDCPSCPGWNARGITIDDQVDPGSFGEVLGDDDVIRVPLLVLQIQDRRIAKVKK